MNEFKRQWSVVGAEVLAATNQVGESGWYILGKEVGKFESDLASYMGFKNAIGVANGMDAIEIGLRALGIERGCKVLTTPLTAFATTLAIMRVGAVPVFVDTDSRGLIDLELCGANLKKDRAIKAMVPVHLYGFSVALDSLKELRDEFQLLVVEDCAQAIGAAYGSMKVGTVGQVSATSFYPTKNLGAMGDGGAVLTNDDEIALKSKAIRNYGQSSQYIHAEIGLNSRLDELHASILSRAMLPHLDTWTKRRSEVAKKYLDTIENNDLLLLRPIDGEAPSWHLFPAIVKSGLRQSFQAHLLKNEIASAVHYPRIVPEQEALRAYGSYEVKGGLSMAKSFAENEVSLPIHPFLTDAEVERVIEACNSWKP